MSLLALGVSCIVGGCLIEYLLLGGALLAGLNALTYIRGWYRPYDPNREPLRYVLCWEAKPGGRLKKKWYPSERTCRRAAKQKREELEGTGLRVGVWDYETNTADFVTRADD